VQNNIGPDSNSLEPLGLGTGTLTCVRSSGTAHGTKRAGTDTPAQLLSDISGVLQDAMDKFIEFNARSPLGPMEDLHMKIIKLKAGTIIKISGIPLRISGTVQAEISESNYRLLCSQDEQLPSNPVQAALNLDKVTTNTLSLEPM
jgi:hypothetical protein